jgi:CRISPR type IV-associated protein Csf3
MMQPIRIQAIMQDGRIGTTDSFLPLDSILAAEWMRRHHPEAYYNASSHMLTNGLIDADLPFERRGQGDNWYWACSFNTEAPVHEYIMHWHKRFDDHLDKYIDFGKRRGKIDTKSGKYKAYRMPLVVQLFDKLVWYAVGDSGAVLDLCQGVTHIGKKSSQGLGAVDYWTVEPWLEDWSVARDGQITRGIPVELGLPPGVERANVQLYGIRPPYWLHQHQRPCFMPEVGKGNG